PAARRSGGPAPRRTPTAPPTRPAPARPPPGRARPRPARRGPARSPGSARPGARSWGARFRLAGAPGGRRALRTRLADGGDDRPVRDPDAQPVARPDLLDRAQHRQRLPGPVGGAAL